MIGYHHANVFCAEYIMLFYIFIKDYRAKYMWECMFRISVTSQHFTTGKLTDANVLPVSQIRTPFILVSLMTRS
jgi:hypothetical protein